MEPLALTTPTAMARVPLAELIRELAASGLAAVVAGIAVGGIGGRLAMRVSAMINPAVDGRISANGDRIGDITPDGTLALIVFGGIFAGLVAGVAWVAVRPWLPAQRKWRSWTAAIAAVGLAGSFVIQSTNFDFFILDPAWLHVVMFTAIVAGAGAVTESIDRRLVARWRDAKGFTLGASVMLMLGAPIAVPLLGSYFSEDMCGCDNPPRVAGTLLVAALGATAFTWLFRWKGAGQPQWLRRLGRGASAAAVSVGLVYVADSIAIIL